MNPRIQDLIARVILAYALVTAPLEVAAVALLFYVRRKVSGWVVGGPG